MSKHQNWTERRENLERKNRQKTRRKARREVEALHIALAATPLEVLLEG
jgi:hypothetical protein